jgi:hypothetical protein
VGASGARGATSPLRRTLPATIKVNRYDSGPGQAGFAHDERESGQEEIYIPIHGDGVLRVGGEDVSLARGVFVLVTAEELRHVLAGDGGLAYIVVGAVPT